MEILLTILMFFLISLIMAVFLWVAMKIVRVDGAFAALFIASAISTLLGLVPYAGGILAIVALLYLLYKWTDMDNWLMGIVIVVLARVLGTVVYALIYSVIHTS